jgi:hypothetical protein
MGSLLDDLSRQLAEPIPRRRALAILGAGVVTALVPALRPGRARAQGAQPDPGCGDETATCERQGKVLCGAVSYLGCIFQCCDPSDGGCCITYNDKGPDSAGCCPAPDYGCVGPRGSCACVNPCGGSCCSSARDEVCLDPETSRCCPKPQVCGDDCCPDGQKCVDQARHQCCPIDKVACYGAFGALACCAPDEECCASHTVEFAECCGKGATCDQDKGSCVCKPGKKQCQGTLVGRGVSQRCCDPLFEQCCKTGVFNHCEPITYTCCGETSCPPGKVCCGGAACYDPADERCCGNGACGRDEDCCRDAVRGCCPAGMHCCGAGCCNAAGKRVAARRAYRSAGTAHEGRGVTPLRRRPAPVRHRHRTSRRRRRGLR